MGGLGLPELVVIALVTALIWPFGRILLKAGYSAWLALLVFVPGFNLVLLFWFALADWPALRRGGAGER